ncbi:MAG TPA: response regulator [Verrucomicrobiales bacterium]|jgi:CheY-like chemotaxis protein|nr:response regulator [Verrucomicrobiales bacterium]
MSSPLSQEDNPLDAPPLMIPSGILIVDEDPAFQLGLKTFLREYVGFEKVFIARNGREALDFIHSETSIDVVTLDYRMPGMSGIEVVKSLCESQERPLSIIMITGYPSEELELEFREQGNDTVLTTHFLSKPVHFEKLEHIILDAQEEVLRVKAELATKHNLIEMPLAPGALEPNPLRDTLEEQSLRITSLEQELKRQRGKWRSDFWKLALLIAAIWLAGEFGLWQKVTPRWETLKATIVDSFTKPFPSPNAKSEPKKLLKQKSAPELAPGDAAPGTGQPL